MKKVLFSIVVIGVIIMTLAIGRAGTNSFQDDVKQYIAYGWMDEPEVRTWTYVSTISTADADVYLVHINEDVTGLIGPNLKVRLYNPTVKYFGILSVGAFADGVTPVYLFGGTDYALDGGEAISNISFSSAKAPIGFPMNPDKWTVEIVDSSYLSQSPVTTDVWYNFKSIILPAGLWDVEYKAFASGNNSISNIEIWTTLSTANNSQSNSRTTDIEYVLASGTSSGLIGTKMTGDYVAELATQTTLYLNVRSITNVSLLYLGGNSMPTVIRAVWGGL